VFLALKLFYYFAKKHRSNKQQMLIVMILLLPRCCAYFSLQTLKRMINICPLPPGCVGLATALVADGNET